VRKAGNSFKKKPEIKYISGFFDLNAKKL